VAIQEILQGSNVSSLELYELYLTYVFVVFAVVDVFRATGASLEFGILWYPPAGALLATRDTCRQISLDAMQSCAKKALD
jgi:ABC-type Mn2+/Zn2+ transport system permease subunit